jgi:phosphoglycerate dehydrogenase-like enzyme
MGFRLLLLDNLETEETRGMVEAWPGRLREEIPGVDVHLAHSEAEADAVIGGIDAAYGKLGPELFAKARRLRWIQSPQAGPDPSFYHPALVESDVVVTNMRGIFSDHISAHILAFLLTFARGLHVYLDRQRAHLWRPGAPTVFLPESTAVIVGVGAIGAETARLCAELGMTVIGVDPRLEAAPKGVSRLVRPEALDSVLPEADFVVVTAPETPATQRLFDAAKFRLMKQSAFFINIGRGATVVLDDLNAALRGAEIAGAALDVFQVEPLPAEHALWDAPGMLITPHVATVGPHLNERRTEVVLDNCRRFDAGQPLRNVVDKASWF